VFAHGVLLSDAELALLAARRSAVAHCPLSNMFFAGRILPVAQLLRRGVKVGGRGGGVGAPQDDPHVF
jgi:guanine deaminase